MPVAAVPASGADTSSAGPPTAGANAAAFRALPRTPPMPAWKLPAQRGQQCAIGRLDPRTSGPPPQNRQLVTQYEDLQLLRAIGAPEKQDEPEQASDPSKQATRGAITRTRGPIHPEIPKTQMPGQGLRTRCGRGVSSPWRSSYRQSRGTSPGRRLRTAPLVIWPSSNGCGDDPRPGRTGSVESRGRGSEMSRGESRFVGGPVWAATPARPQGR